MRHNSFLFSLLLFVIMGCVGLQKEVPLHKAVWKTFPESPSIENDIFRADLYPTHFSFRGCDGFHIVIKNKTEKNLEINWNRTLYMANGQTNGTFMYDGILYKDRNANKPPDFVLPKGNFEKKIYPANLVTFSDSNWIHLPIGQGNHGIFLSLVIDGKEINETLTFTIERNTVLISTPKH